MITVLSGTNRQDNRTRLLARHYVRQLQDLGAEAQLLDLADLDNIHYVGAEYSATALSPELLSIQKQYVLGAGKLVIFSPEYNGGFPGILKLFIDSISLNAYRENFTGKVIGLVGVASGRAGNLRGMEHLAGVLAYLGAWILPNKLPVSNVEALLTDDQLTDTETIAALKTHAKQLIAA
ncbi:MAG: NAD(P)H-dependent oxidoreductase [Bacteroidota bacterium]